MQAEQRHQVHRARVSAGHRVDVAEVVGVELRGERGRRTTADAPDPRGRRRTRRTRRRRRPPWPPGQPGMARMRIALPRWYRGAVHEVLAHLLPGALRAKKARGPDPSIGSIDRRSISVSAVASVSISPTSRCTPLRNASSSWARRCRSPGSTPSRRPPRRSRGSAARSRRTASVGRRSRTDRSRGSRPDAVEVGARSALGEQIQHSHRQRSPSGRQSRLEGDGANDT